MPIRINWDFLGIATSIACAFHCAALPILVSTLPVFGINIVHNAFFEWVMIAIAFLVGSYSLLHGYARHHKNTAPLIIFSAGAVFLALKQVYYSAEYLFLGVAVVFIITAHLINYRYCHEVKTCKSPHHKH